MNKESIEEIRQNPNRTVLMMVNELSKLFEDSIIQDKEIPLLKEKTARLILAYLAINDGVTQQQLVKVTQMKGSTVSVAVTKMENEGYIVRKSNEYDMRSVKIHLTKKGRALSDEAKRFLDQKDSKIMHGIAERDIRIAKYVLEKMIDNLLDL